MDARNEYFVLRGVAYSSYKAYRLPPYLVKVLPDPSSRVLDIGCGLGQMLLALRARGFQRLTGIDVSVEAVTACRKEGLEVELIENLAQWASAYDGPQFNFILMSHVLEHIEKTRIIDTLRIIRERLLAKRGRLCIMVPNAQSNTDCYWAYEDFTHATLFTAGSLLYVLGAAGFTCVRLLDPDGTAGTHPLVRLLKKLIIKLYILNKLFWNGITGSAYHKASPMIFTYEVKALASLGDG